MESAIKNELLPLLAKADIQCLKGDNEKELLDSLEHYTDPALVVMGTYGRSAISCFHHESLPHVILENTICSLVIAHS